MYQRFAARHIVEARSDTPVILLAGARQTGKSTLAQAAARSEPDRPIRIDMARSGSTVLRDARYLTFDDATFRAAATADPHNFVESFRSVRWVVFDEIQRVPELLLAIKQEVDLDRRPGRFLLTGSSDVMTIPNIAESLAGRVEIIPIWALAQAEIEGFSSRFIANAFSAKFPQHATAETIEQIVMRALRGGYPEPLLRPRPSRRDAWFGNYITTVVQREITNISAIEDTTAIVRVLRALATRSGGPRNFQTLSIDAALPASTLTRYVTLLEATFLIRTIPAWSNNIDARIMKSPKLLITDSGLYGYLLGLHENDDAVGYLIETFVGCELAKLFSLYDDEVSLMHFRDKRGNEVDFVLERRDRSIVGIEVKKSRSVQISDFRGLQKLAQAAGERFVRGIVLYGGYQTVSFGAQLLAAPIASLWTAPEH